MFTANSLGKIRGINVPLIYLLFISFFFLSHVSFSQKISKHYISSVQSNGTIYFILPQKGFKSKEHKSSLIYDLTYLSSGDTVIFNFSYFDKKQKEVDSLGFHFNNTVYSSKGTKIFVETKGSSWHYRYTYKIPFKVLNEFYDQQNTPHLILYSKQGKIILSMGESKWKKQSARTKKILLLISYNK